MENNRSASLSIKQGFGIIAGLFAVIVLFSIPFALFAAIIVNLEKNDGKDLAPMLIGSLIGCVIVFAIAITIAAFSIRLLKDPHGMVIPWLEKRFNGKKKV